ncbi:MAG: flavodoxin-dependent (E)-4-hydroxy-3-methylbut-2-enyl-diphosphate synthase, partial [Eubacteriales bacterium]
MKEIQRRQTRTVMAGGIPIGSGHPISVQSMTNTPAHDVAATVGQIERLAAAGCDIVRVAVPDPDAAAVFAEAKKRGISCPLVADIHFDYRIALEALKCGADKIRINPGNIGEAWKVREVAAACRASGVPIRIG